MKQWITIIAVLGAVFLFAGCSGSSNSQKAPAGTTAPADTNAS